MNLKDAVQIRDTHVGKGVFAAQDFPFSAVIGEIEGTIIVDRNYASSYCFDLEDDCQLEPDPPFRYVNHSCDPNCEFDWFFEADSDDVVTTKRLYLITLREISNGEELTIDYNWPAEGAIRCECNSPLCRGWIVSVDEIDQVEKNKKPDFRIT